MTGADYIDADPIRSVLRRHLASEPDDGRLDCFIRQPARRDQQAVHRREIDHRATTRPTHVWHGILGRAEHGFEADVHRAVPAFLRKLNGVAGQDPRIRIVDDDIQPTPQLDRPLDHAADSVRGTDVGVDELGTPARRADRLDIVGGRLILDVGDEHATSVMREASCGCSANAHGTTAYNCNLPLDLWKGYL